LLAVQDKTVLTNALTISKKKSPRFAMLLILSKAFDNHGIWVDANAVILARRNA
jgi:hypothetical protein